MILILSLIRQASIPKQPRHFRDENCVLGYQEPLSGKKAILTLHQPPKLEGVLGLYG